MSGKSSLNSANRASIYKKKQNQLDTTTFPQHRELEEIFDKEDLDKTSKENNTTTIPKEELLDQETAGKISQLKPGSTEMSSWEDDSYKEYTNNLIFALKKKGLSHKKIAEKLTQMNLKTRTGLDKWSSGTVGKILKREKIGG